MKKKADTSRRIWLLGGMIVLSGALSIAFLAAPQGQAGAQEAEAQETIRMRIATVAPEGTPWEKQLRSLRSYIRRESGNRIRVQMFMGGSLGGEKALVRRTARGSLEAFGGSAAAVGTIVRELNVIEAPFLFDNAAQADRALDAPQTRTLVSTALSKRGFVFGAYAENGFRSWFTRERVIRSPSDLRGLRMRSQESEAHLATYRAFGASPVPIDVTNVLTSLQTGVVDGFDNTPLFAFATSWYQAAHHLTLSEHTYQPGLVVWSKTWYDGLPADLRRVLDNVPQSITTEGRSQVRRMDPILIRNLERHGISVVRLTAAQRAAFARTAQPVQARVASQAGGPGRALLNQLRNASR